MNVPRRLQAHTPLWLCVVAFTGQVKSGRKYHIK